MFKPFCFLSCLLVPAHGNEHPIVLVHGFSGWGRDEMGGVKYWGGVQGDLQKILRDEGHRVFTASVGPFSSNWDRACELFAQIKGGRVDYGEAHSLKYNHSRYGREYAGFFPQWGTLDEHGNTQKVHLVGHSMGGQTIRMLSQLLAKGTKGAPVNEMQVHSELFRGGHENWIHSITTFSTPHRGTVLGSAFSTASDLVINVFARFLGLVGTLGASRNRLFDAKLDQWGLKPRQPSEGHREYLKRVFSSGLFAQTRDFSLFDLSLDGAAEMNVWVHNHPQIFYFSYSTQDTYESTTLWRMKRTKVYKPHRRTMLLPFQPLASFVGGVYTSLIRKLPTWWQPNDGVVNTYSMQGSDDSVVHFLGNVLRPQVWNHMPLLDRIDHGSVLGFTMQKDVVDIYRNHAALLRALSTDRVSNASAVLLQSIGDVVGNLGPAVHEMN